MKLISHGEEVLLKRYKIRDKKMYMFVAHTMAYDINEFMGFSSVEWMKRKVIFSKVTGLRQSEIIVADYTLAYQRVIVKNGLNVFPKWSDKEQKGFYYTFLSGIKPVLKYVNIKNGKAKTLLSSDGMLVCSDVSEDSKKLLLTMAPKGQPDVYLYDVYKRKYKRITKFSGIDVNGQFMGDDRVIFVSNRLGYPNIFLKNLINGDIEQLVSYGKSNSSCSVSGEYVVYKARESSSAFSKNTFNLHLISLKTDFIRRLTAVGINEFPRFSIDGDAILFIKNYKTQSALGVIRLKHNKNYLFPLKYGKIQSIDW
jgi:TolB protein